MTFEIDTVFPLLVSGGSVGVGLAVGLQAMKWLLTFLAARYDKRNEAIDDAEQRLFERMERQIISLTERVEKAEQGLAECTEEHARSRAEVMELRAQIQGYGNARDQAALIVAAEKKGGKQ